MTERSYSFRYMYPNVIESIISSALRKFLLNLIYKLLEYTSSHIIEIVICVELGKRHLILRSLAQKERHKFPQDLILRRLSCYSSLVLNNAPRKFRSLASFHKCRFNGSRLLLLYFKV
ncbi:hypothetical protein Mp_zg00810 [Marchantia polymorpha subsp. ruderalis]|uniref:Uncharacterized protein n=2 Tax=Marchantia polymorpha TaxID=3197 RepID=A0A679DXR0_MARPO|nr:hypothetical protein MARPO_2566s0001 [Marchantia polymorpha]BBN20690.1 hypothetical protein Mp_zg00210 [Marchantia polymorpha subsp. ruderalis]BBN20740.1 hypothetical protein Mp_zg00810 [Marchantia polymorpha subsp. ruderalis]|eukprot:PTQ26354.1 hypothetical protein MARPO_2566s0001 [Marchantia polymorpha]